MVLEGLCCPGSRCRHEVREGTGLQLSEKNNRNSLSALRKTCSGSFKHCVILKPSSKKDSDMLVTLV